MGNRRKTIIKGVVVDLDGTLLSTNSFKHYILFVCFKAFMLLQYNICFSIVINVIKRKIRLVSHQEMKRNILIISSQLYSSIDISSFINKLIRKTNTSVLRLINNYRKKGYYICLSTAAPNIYAETIAKYYQFNGCCATITPIFNHDWNENIGDYKLKTTLDLFNAHNIELSVVITDHQDDLPLLKKNNGTNIVVSPNKKTIKILRSEGIYFRIL